jgi:hypothetical protein
LGRLWPPDLGLIRVMKGGWRCMQGMPGKWTCEDKLHREGGLYGSEHKTNFKKGRPIVEFFLCLLFHLFISCVSFFFLRFFKSLHYLNFQDSLGVTDTMWEMEKEGVFPWVLLLLFFLFAGGDMFG